MFKVSMRFAAVVLLVSLSSLAVAQPACIDVFADGASAHSAGGAVNLGYLATITGGGGTLQAPSVSQNPGGVGACSGSVCAASGTPSASSTPSFQYGNGSDGRVNVGFFGSANVPEGDYRNIDGSLFSLINMNTSGGTYYTRRIDIRNWGSLYMAPGDYWVNGSVNFRGNTILGAIGDGTVRIFVEGNVTLQGGFRTLGFGPGELLIYSTGRITLDDDAQFDGFLYSERDVDLSERVIVNGAVAGASVDIEEETRINYPGAVLPTLDFEPLCRGVPLTPPDPVAVYHLDERDWTGAAGEVEDSGPTGMNGYAVNLGAYPDTDDVNPAIPGYPGTCGYGVFDGTADGYVEIPENGSGLLDFIDEFSVSVWIYPRSYPGGDIQTIVSKDTNFEFHVNTAGQIFWWWGGGIQELTSASTVPLNAWSHITITHEIGLQKIYINGVEDASTNSVNIPNTNNDSLFIGTDLNFHSRRFDGYIDEVKLFDEALNDAQVVQVMNQTHACPVALLSHYSVSHSGSGLTCQSEIVTITAHDDTHGAVDADSYVIEVTASSASAGWSVSDVTWLLESGAGSFSTPSPGVARYEFAPGESAVALRLANTSAATIDIDVQDTLGNTDSDGDAVEDAPLAFTDTGFLFFNDANADGNGDGVPIHSPVLSATNSPQLVVQAVRTDTNTGACVARLQSASQSVDFAYECVNPTVCQLDRDMAINGVDVEENDLGNVVDFQALNLTFDSEGEATLNFNYADVGEVRLHARLNLPANSTEGPVTLAGTSDSTVVYPADLVVSNVETLAGVANPGSTTNGSGFVQAGSPFRVNVQARNANGRITPNFGSEISPESVTLQAARLVMPVGGELTPLNAAASFSLSATAGELVNNQVNWPQVGTLTVNAVSDASYLSSGQQIIGSESANIGRIFPQHFQLVGAAVTEGCAAGGFTYMSDSAFVYRPLVVGGSIDTLANGVVLSNYDQALGYPVAQISPVAENNNDGIDLSARVNLEASTFVAGRYQWVNARAGLARALSGANEVPDGPLRFVQLGVQATGQLDDEDFQTADLNVLPTAANDCVADGNCNAAALGGAMQFLFGRLSAENAHGPESAALRVNLRVEYWNGTEFVTNTQDSCTAIDLSEVSFAGASLDNDASRTVAVGASNTTGSFASFTPGDRFLFVDGDAGLQFSAPGVGNTGSFDIGVDLTNYPFLKGDWDSDGNYANDGSLPNVNVNFGRYRGNDRVIYWREVLN